MPSMFEETAIVAENVSVHGDYRRLTLDSPRIAAAAQPGQFVHLLIPGGDNLALRRPFSIHRAENSRIALLYKPVGTGTRMMTMLNGGAGVSLIGPLGRGFPLDLPAGAVPVLVAGGYGMAALYPLAQRLPRTGMLFAGGADARDILCRAEFAGLGWPLEAATENGSLGVRGMVTAPLDAWLEREPGLTPWFYACGPHGMLRAVAERAARREGCRAWLSMDRRMGCGVGACLACVQKLRAPAGATGWGRVCRDGPVFDAREIVWE